jgi:predicted transcriptional regulator
MAGRTTIQLDPDLAARLRDIVPSRGINRFINQAVAEKLGALERERLEAELREGYEAAERLQAEISSDWDSVGLEDWPN